MSIQGVSKTYLPSKVLKPTQRLLQRMNQTTKRVESNSGLNFSSKILSDIKINGNLSLNDSSCFTTSVKKDVLLNGEATLALREPKASITFDKKTGAILSTEPPYLQYQFGYKDVLTTMKKHLNQAERDFKKPGVVKKNFWGVEGYTSKGSQRLEQATTVVQVDTNMLKSEPKKKSFVDRVLDKLDKFLASR